MAIISPISLGLEFSEKRVSELAPKIAPTENANLPIGLFEAAEVLVIQEFARMREQIEAMKVVDDLMEVERMSNKTSQVRVSLGPLDQNTVREILVESEANMKIGKWKRLARSVKKE